MVRGVSSVYMSIICAYKCIYNIITRLQAFDLSMQALDVSPSNDNSQGLCFIVITSNPYKTLNVFYIY